MKQVIVLRDDLNMRKGKMVAQGAHASVSVAISMMPFITIPKHPHGDAFNTWLGEGQKKIAVRVSSEAELGAIYQKALGAGIAAVIITDAGHTEFNGVPTKTCVAIGPGPDEEIDKITGELKLL